MKLEQRERLEKIQERKDQVLENLSEQRFHPSRRPIESDQSQELLMLLLEEQRILLEEILETIESAAEAMNKLYETAHNWLSYEMKKG